MAVCALLGGAGQAWADCTATPSGATPSGGVLVPQSNDTVNCSGTSNVSVSNDSADNVTVSVSDTLTPAATQPPINLNEGSTITNGGVITGDNVGGNLGAITIRGAGNRIVNRNTIQATNSAAIQGAVSGERAIGAVLENFGTITANAATAGAVRLGEDARVINSGDIHLQNGDNNSPALAVGQGSFIQNQASGRIGAVEAPGASRQVLAVEIFSGSTLINDGTIEVQGTARGIAVAMTEKGSVSRIANSGTIDASGGGDAIRSGDAILVENSGTIRGGAGYAINIDSGDGSSVVLQQGSRVEGTIWVRDAGSAPLTDAELGYDQVVIDYCRQYPTELGCVKTFRSLPNQATLGLEGTGTEDDRFTGFNLIEKRGPGAWTLFTDLQAGSATDGYQSGDFRVALEIDVQDAAGVLDLAGTISDNPDGTKAFLDKAGPGTLRLSGNSPSTGNVGVSQGILDMAGTTAMRVVISPNGTLVGTGTVGGVTNNGRVAPGNSVGTLTVSGDYAQAPGGTLDIEIKPDGSANDLLAVGGTASLAGTLTAQGENGALLTPAAGGTQASPRLYTILTAGGGVSGQFGTEPGPLGAFTFDTIYNPYNVQLGVIYTGFTPVQTGTAITGALTPGVIPGTGTTNQITKAIALDRIPTVTGFNSGNPDFDAILLEIANETPDQLAATYNAIIAEPYAAFMTVLLEQNDFYAETVLERAQLCSARGRGSLAGGYSPQQGVGGAPLTAGCPDHERHGVWIDATWLQGNIDGDDGLSGYDYRLAGAVVGVDTSVGNNATVGAAFGFGQPKFDDYDLADAEIDGDSYMLSAYGTLTRERWEFFGLLGYTFGSYDSERRIRFGSIDRKAEGGFDGDGFIASAKAAYDYPVHGFDLIPEVGITYSKVWQDGFTETGAGSLNLRVNDADAHSLVTSLGVRVGTEIQSGDTRIRPQALLRYEYDWNASDDDAHDIVSSFATVPVAGSIDVIGRNRGEHGLLLAGGVTVQVSETANLFAGAGYRWNSNGDEYNFGVGARMAW